MVSVPILFGGFFRLVLGLLVDRIGAKRTGIIAQLVVITGLLVARRFGLKTTKPRCSWAWCSGWRARVCRAMPQAGRWYPPHMQGLGDGLAGAGNIGVVIDSLLAPRLAAAYGWPAVFGFALIPAVFVLAIYIIVSKEPPVTATPKKVGDYFRMFRDKDVHWFCFFYTVTFGGFVGLAYSLGMYFKDRFALSPSQAGDLVALCTAIGALGRPIGGGISDRIGGIRSLYIYYSVAGVALICGGLINSMWLNVAAFSFRHGQWLSVPIAPATLRQGTRLMTGLVGCGGGLGGFLLANMMGQSKQHFGNLLFGRLRQSVLALGGLTQVKTRWRTTWARCQRLVSEPMLAQQPTESRMNPTSNNPSAEFAALPEDVARAEDPHHELRHRSRKDQPSADVCDGRPHHDIVIAALADGVGRAEMGREAAEKTVQNFIS